MLLVLFSFAVTSQFSKSDYLTHVETKVGIDRAYTQYEYCNPTSSDFIRSTKEDFSVVFDTKRGVLEANRLELWQTVLVEKPTYVKECKDTQIPTSNSSFKTEQHCVNIQKGTELVQQKKWVETDLAGFNFKKQSCYDIRVVGEFEPSTQPKSIDNIISSKGMTFDEYAWWNTTHSRCRNLTITTPTIPLNWSFPDNMSWVFSLGEINASSWDNKPHNSTIQIVDTYCDNGGNAIPREVMIINQTTTGVSDFFELWIHDNLTEGDNQYALYYSEIPIANPLLPLSSSLTSYELIGNGAADGIYVNATGGAYDFLRAANISDKIGYIIGTDTAGNSLTGTNGNDEGLFLSGYFARSDETGTSECWLQHNGSLVVVVECENNRVSSTFGNDQIDDNETWVRYSFNPYGVELLFHFNQNLSLDSTLNRTSMALWTADDFHNWRYEVGGSNATTVSGDAFVLLSSGYVVMSHTGTSVNQFIVMNFSALQNGTGSDANDVLIDEQAGGQTERTHLGYSDSDVHKLNNSFRALWAMTYLSNGAELHNMGKGLSDYLSQSLAVVISTDEQARTDLPNLTIVPPTPDNGSLIIRNLFVNVTSDTPSGNFINHTKFRLHNGTGFLIRNVSFFNQTSSSFNFTETHINVSRYGSAYELIVTHNDTEGNNQELARAYNLATFTVNVFDEITRNPFEYQFNLDVIGDEFSTSVNGTNETSVPGMPLGSYTLRFSSPGWSQRFHIFEYGGSATPLVLYMISSGNASDLIINVKDENFDNLENVTVQALRYYIDDNAFSVVEMGRTGLDGNAELHLEKDNEFYKFILLFRGTARTETVGTIVTDNMITNGLNFQISTVTNALETLEDLIGVSAGIFYNNDTSTFRFTYANQGTIVSQGCLDINLMTSSGVELYNQSCVSSTSASILIPIDRTTGGQYVAVGTLEATDGTEYTVGSLSVSISEAVTTLGVPVLFLAVFIVGGIAFMGIFNPKVMIMTTGLGIATVAIFQFAVFSWVAVAGVIVMGMVVAMRLKVSEA
jgi:hypothetical protein